MLQIDVGDTSAAAPDVVPVSVSPGQTVNVANVAGGSVNYFTNGIDGAPTALASGNNVNLTASSWLQCTGAIATVQITGGMYG